MNISIYGCGYVGLVTAACLADVGNHVIAVDIDKARISALNEGIVPIFEPGLEAIIKRNIASGRLSFTTDYALAVDHGTFQFIAVGTPPGEDGSADLQHVLAVAKRIGQLLTEHKIIVNKSTVPVGTAARVREALQAELAARGETITFDVASNPEFLKEGAAIEDFMKPDRVVIGVDNEETEIALSKLYEPFNRNHQRVVSMDIRSAELTKYAANAMLATKISFMNELANVAERVGADIEQVRVGIGSDSRIGYHFIYPGAGFGGSCFPKDVRALVRSGAAVDYDMPLLKAVEAVNEAQKKVLFQKIHRRFAGELAGKTIALWGLAFKPNTDDMREAPSLVLIRDLMALGVAVQAYDPKANTEAARLFANSPQLAFFDSAEAALTGADALAVITEWREFRSPDFAVIKNALKHPIIFDGRNIYDPEVIKRAGIELHSIGRHSVVTV